MTPWGVPWWWCLCWCLLVLRGGGATDSFPWCPTVAALLVVFQKMVASVVSLGGGAAQGGGVGWCPRGESCRCCCKTPSFRIGTRSPPASPSPFTLFLPSSCWKLRCLPILSLDPTSSPTSPFLLFTSPLPLSLTETDFFCLSSPVQSSAITVIFQYNLL